MCRRSEVQDRAASSHAKLNNTNSDRRDAQSFSGASAGAGPQDGCGLRGSDSQRARPLTNLCLVRELDGLREKIRDAAGVRVAEREARTALMQAAGRIVRARHFPSRPMQTPPHSPSRRASSSRFRSVSESVSGSAREVDDDVPRPRKQAAVPLVRLAWLAACKLRPPQCDAQRRRHRSQEHEYEYGSPNSNFFDDGTTSFFWHAKWQHW